MIRVWPWPLAPAVHSTRKRRSESRGLDSWFAGGSFSVAATGPAGHAIASAAVSGSATVTISDRHELIGIPPVLWPAGGSPVAAASVPPAALEAAPTMDPATAVEPASESAAARSSRESVGPDSPVEIARALLAQLSGLMRLFVLGRRPAEASPAPAPGVFLPVALAVPTVHVAVATRIHVASAEAPSSEVPVIDEVSANVFTPVVVHVHVTDAVMPAPATAAVPPPAVMPAPVGSEGEAELEPGEDVDPEAQVERAPAPGHRPRVPESARPTRIDVAGSVDHDWSGRHHRSEIARRVARVHHVRRSAVHIRIRDVVERGARWDRIDHGWNARRHRPRSGQRRGDKPHAVLERVVRGRVDADHRE